jgi:CcmD family protein
MNNPGYLLAAYAFLWLAIFGYMYTITRRLSTLDRDIQALRDELERKSRKE